MSRPYAANVRGDVDVAELGALIADRVRSAILMELLGGEAIAASELARRARTSPSGASNHLKRLLAGGLVRAQTVGRSRYYRLANDDVAQALEALGRISNRKRIGGLRDANAAELLARARTCYDHLAGTLGVRFTEWLLAEALIRRRAERFEVSQRGANWLYREMAIDVEQVKVSRRSLAIPCLDLTERRPHLAGALGAAIAETFLNRDLARRAEHSRALHVTDKGSRWLAGLGVLL